MVKAGSLLLAGVALALAQDGVVRSGGQPIPGATVTATAGTQKFSSLSDEDGRYHFKVLPSGTWTIEIESFGFVSQKKEVTISAIPAVETWNLDLRPKPAAPAPDPALGRRRAAGGFQNVTLNQSAADAQIAAAPEPSAVPENANASEAFVVSGSLTQGLSQARPEDTFARGPDAGNGQNNPFGEAALRRAKARAVALAGVEAVGVAGSAAGVPTVAGAPEGPVRATQISATAPLAIAMQFAGRPQPRSATPPSMRVSIRSPARNFSSDLTAPSASGFPPAARSTSRT